MNTSWPSSKATTLCRYMQRMGYPVNRFGSTILTPLSEPVYLCVDIMQDGSINVEGGRRLPRKPWQVCDHTQYVEDLCISGFRLLPIEIVDKIATWMVEKGLANV